MNDRGHLGGGAKSSGNREIGRRRAHGIAVRSWPCNSSNASAP
ncbi:hypothetical protein A33M_0838 [Rhodovulum sp. PH10]|nr:hypothetical protein A33M_0838 [Rhodovulum sp. PH10]